MLRELTWHQFLEWMAYSELEPFGEERADLRLAAILRMIFAVNRDSEKVPEVPGVGQFYAGFLADIQEYLQLTAPKEQKPKIAKTQTWQQQKAKLLEYAVHAAVQHETERLRSEARNARRNRHKKAS